MFALIIRIVGTVLVILALTVGAGLHFGGLWPIAFGAGLGMMTAQSTNRS